MRRAAPLLACAIAVLATLAGTAHAQAATIFAASSLRGVFPRIDAAQRFGFGGSGQLALQIRNGAPADLFAAASPADAAELHRAGRCGRPSVFATNTLALIVPRRGRGAITSAQDLAGGRRWRLAVGARGVPVGDYTRMLLARLGLSSMLTRNLVSNEASVAGVVSKVALGSADAGFVYTTDGRIAARKVRTLRLPARAQPAIRHAFCIVRRRGGDAAAAQAFVNRVRSAHGRALLRAAGFGPPRG